MFEDFRNHADTSIILERSNVRILCKQDQPAHQQNDFNLQHTEELVLHFSNSKLSKEFHTTCTAQIKSKQFLSTGNSLQNQNLQNQSVLNQMSASVETFSTLKGLKTNAELLTQTATQLKKQLKLIQNTQQLNECQELLEKIYGFEAENKNSVAGMKLQEQITLFYQRKAEKKQKITKLSQAYGQFNRARGEAISPMEFKNAILNMKDHEIRKIGTFSYVCFKGIIEEIQEYTVQIAENGTNSEVVSQKFGIQTQLATDIIEELVNNEKLAVYDGRGVREYWGNKL
ncbi:EAP30/Vps36_domain-containing protein [Hexamita inflata]|uniref:EAP30/Vps36 domain-containing protein n=1 Tax=Hexamita inflata TaxID=28002 RepID=A0AA86R439_9EUKA|nr:EAP30/Vps36 domain-containing protein [Hexamita inflata]